MTVERDRQMPDLARHAVTPAVHTAVDEQTAAHPGVGLDVRDGVGVLHALGRERVILGQCRHVRVVHHVNRAVQQGQFGCDEGAQIGGTPAEVDGGGDQLGGTDDRSGHGHGELGEMRVRSRLPHRRLGRPHHTPDHRGQRARIAVRCVMGRRRAVQDAAPEVRRHDVHGLQAHLGGEHDHPLRDQPQQPPGTAAPAGRDGPRLADQTAFDELGDQRGDGGVHQSGAGRDLGPGARAVGVEVPQHQGQIAAAYVGRVGGGVHIADCASAGRVRVKVAKRLFFEP